jgi:hypothetical protein
MDLFHRQCTSAIVAEIAKQIEAYERGEPLQNVVKHTLGY